MKIWLTVLFMIGSDASLVDGWQPHEQPDMEVCEGRALLVMEYLATYPQGREVHSVSCITAPSARDAAFKAASYK